MRVFYKKQHPDGSELMEKTVLRTVSDVTVLSVRLLFTCAHDIVDNRRERRKYGIIIPGKNFYQIIIAACVWQNRNQPVRKLRIQPVGKE